jgi:prefoldin subunit 5
MSEENRLESADAAADQTEVEEELTTPILETESKSEGEAEPEPRPDTWPEEPAPPAMIVPKAPKPVTRARVFWTSFGIGLLSFVLAVAVSLGILVTYNGGLWYASPSQVVTISRQVDGLTAQIDAQAQDLEGLRARLDNLEGLSGCMEAVETTADRVQAGLEDLSERVGAVEATAGQVQVGLEGLGERVAVVETTADQVRADLETTASRVDELGQQVDELAMQMEVLQDQSARLQSFLEGLRELLDGLFQGRSKNDH